MRNSTGEVPLLARSASLGGSGVQRLPAVDVLRRGEELTDLTFLNYASGIHNHDALTVIGDDTEVPRHEERAEN